MTTTVASPQQNAEIISACCTSFSNAQCSDWTKSCASGQTSKDGTTSAPADGSNGKTLTQVKYQEMCCDDTPKTCADYSVQWLVSEALGDGCYKNSATKFFDTKKMATTVASPQGDSEITSACCTPFAEAKCSDWTMACSDSSHVEVGTSSAPADGTSGKTLTKTKFDELCCFDALSCNAYTDEVDTSVRQAAVSLLGSLLVAIAIAVA